MTVGVLKGQERNGQHPRNGCHGLALQGVPRLQEQVLPQAVGLCGVPEREETALQNTEAQAETVNNSDASIVI